ncbi:SipW-cognate class signal peptide [Halorubrum aquaticum]|uniref:SipW-cognate class signal peptide n=1 Tax=Halorubrum aquaticum TaxID=387340 RepID=A0A1I3BAI0_9EURY|nr:SipW-dependent-type signal peptide-containing protein [Halorubrum aquaticum]SFH59315.1 SipW-cognate class signal peptide [Halorubrum aquaticum]
MTADGSGRGASGLAGLSRRRLLAGLGGLGAMGAASGAGTFAYLSDEEAFRRNEIGAGEVELEVSCSGSSVDGDCAVSNGTVSFTPEEPIDRGDWGDVTFDVSVRSNPARLWFATTCPRVRDPLGDALDVSLKVGDDWVFPSGSLSDLRREFAGGLRVDDRDGDPCLDPGADALEIELVWELPEDAPAAVAGETTGFEFRLYTEQCRHVSEDEAEAGSNPYAGIECDEPEPECVVCDGEDEDVYSLLEFEYLGNETAYITAGTQGKGTNGEIAFEGDIDPGETFVADGANVGGNSGALGANLYLDDGSDGQLQNGNGRPPGVKVHTSCSEDLYVGQEFDIDGAPRYQIVAGEIFGKGRICGDPTGEDDGDDHDDSGDCECGGNVRYRDLTFRYDGGSDATIRVTTQQTGGGNEVVFEETTIAPGGTFTADGNDVPQAWGNVGTSLGQNTTIEIVDGGDDGATETVEIHTSCSAVLTIGDAFGSDGSGGTLYELVGGTFTDENALCGSEDLQ